MKLIKSFFLLSLIAMPLCSCATLGQEKTQINGDYVMALSVSTDGKYVISTNLNRHAYLWDLQNKTYKDLGSPYNIYSAYFVPNTDYYMIQNDLNNEVIVSDLNQKVIYQFNPKIPSYGEAMSSNLKYYAISDDAGNTYIYYPHLHQRTKLINAWCMGDHGGQAYGGKIPYECAGFRVSGKLSSFEFTNNNKILAATTNSYLYIWNAETTNGYRIAKNVGQTMSAISPDGKYIYTADQQRLGVKYNIETKKAVNYGVMIPDIDKNMGRKKYNINITKLTNFRFIDKDKVLVSFSAVPYPLMWLGLYNVNNMEHLYQDHPKWTHWFMNPIKYLPLVPDPLTFSKGLYGNYKKPYPDTSGYNMSFDTSPSAHILVTAQANGGGIMVYKYNPKDESLKLVWAPELKS